MQRKWTIEELRYLRDNFKYTKTPTLAKHLNRTILSIKRKAEYLKLTKERHNGWTTNEINILKTNFHLPSEELIRLLPKHSLWSILRKGYNEGCYKHQDPNKEPYSHHPNKHQNIRKNNNSYRLLAEKKLGRKLEKWEVVHHINMDDKDNSDSNLCVCRNPSEHRNAHASLNRLTKELLNKGIIKFDPDSKVYLLSDNAR